MLLLTLLSSDLMDSSAAFTSAATDLSQLFRRLHTKKKDVCDLGGLIVSGTAEYLVITLSCYCECECVCTDLQSTMAPLLTLTQLFRLSAPTVSTSILPNRSERADETDINSYQYINSYSAQGGYVSVTFVLKTDINAVWWKVGLFVGFGVVGALLCP